MAVDRKGNALSFVCVGGAAGKAGDSVLLASPAYVRAVGVNGIDRR